MGGDDLRCRDLRFLQQTEQKLQFTGTRSQVAVEDAGFSSQHSPYPALGRQASELGEGGLGGTVIGYGDFSGSDDFVDEHEIGSHGSGQRLYGDFVGSGEDEGRDPFMFKGIGLGQKRAHVSGDAVGAQASDQSGHAARCR